jgi:predicted lipid-binding transport protein (Tim44 family)
MRMIFGVLGLVIVLAIIGSVAKKQLQAMRLGPGATSAQASAPQQPTRHDAFSPDPNKTVRQQAQDTQGTVRDDVVRALHKGEERSDKAQP